MPSLKQHNEFQRQYFAKTNKKMMHSVNTPYLHRHLEKTIDFAVIKPYEHLLEVGCGMGRYTLLLARAGYQISGLDLTPELLRSLQDKLGPEYDIPLYHGDIHNPPHHLDGQFDIVVGFFTLHHLFDIRAALLGIKRLLRPGGRTVFLEPNPFNPLYYLQIACTPGMTWKGDRGILNMTPHQIKRDFISAGYREIKFERFGFFPPVLANMAGVQAIERVIEKIPLISPVLPFQLFIGSI